MSIYFHLDDTPQLRLEVSVKSHLAKRNLITQLFSPLPDIDSGIVMKDTEGNAIDESYYGKLASKDGSIQHRSDDTVNTSVIPNPAFVVEQYDIDLSHVNYSIDSFSIFLYSASPLNIHSRQVENMNVSLVVPDNDISVHTSSYKWDNPDFQGIHIGGFQRISKQEWQFDAAWKPGTYTDIRSCHYITDEFNYCSGGSA